MQKALPNPLPAPVTIATRPSSRPIASSRSVGPSLLLPDLRKTEILGDYLETVISTAPSDSRSGMSRGGSKVHVFYRKTVKGELGEWPHSAHLGRYHILAGPAALGHIDVSHLYVHRGRDMRRDDVVLGHVGSVPRPLLPDDLHDLLLHPEPVLVAEETVRRCELLHKNGVFALGSPSPVPDAVRSHNGNQFVWDTFDEELCLMSSGEIVWVLRPPVETWAHAYLGIIFRSCVLGKLVQGKIAPE